MVTLAVCVVLTALMPLIEYLAILRKDPNMNIAFAAAIWAGCLLILCVGIWAYYSMIPLLLGGHAALACIAGSAMVVAYTQVYYSADVRCSIHQISLDGCASCSCAATNTCNTVRAIPAAGASPF